MTDQSSGEYGRPRRPSPETVSYLNGLPLDENLASQQAREYVAYFQNKSKNESDETNNNDDDEPPEYPPMLSATHAALSSIFREFASLACEEIPSQQVETLVRIACRYSLVAKRVVLAGMASYWTFCSTHRFGSHVAQTVLRCAVADCEVNLDEFDDEGKMVIEDSYGSLLQDSEDGSAEGTALSGSISKLILQSVEELKQFAPELVVHVCGSHVLRTSLCVLSGVEFVEAFAHPSSNNAASHWDTGTLAATRRGKFKDKKKKKKKKGNPSIEEDKCASRQEVTVVKAMKVVQELTMDGYHEAADILLKEMVDIISLSDGQNNDGSKEVQPPGELQERTCHPSAGPLLVQMLRLLAYRDFDSQQQLSSSKKKRGGKKKDIKPDRRLVILPQEPTYSEGSQAESLVHRLICWDASIATNNNNDDNDAEGEDATTKQPYTGDIIYGLSGEPRGSILLEAILRCCPDSFHDALCSVGGFYDEGTLREYIKHGVSNFVVQMILMTVRSKEQASKLVKCLCGIVEDGSILNVKHNKDSGDATAGDAEDRGKSNIQRMGIVWRAVEMCATIGSSQDQEQLLSALLRGYGATATSSEDDDTKNDEKKRKKRSKAKGLSVEKCIPHLLGLAPGSYTGEDDFSRLTIDAAGARTIYHILQFKERLRTDWVNGILNIYEREDFVKIANDGLGSKCITDALLDGPARPIASKAILSKLSDRIVYLATERVGHHTVEKIFRALPTMEDKAALSADFSHSLNKLGSNAMGRSVMTTCAVKEYLEGENEWKEALAKQKGKEDWLDDILGENEKGSDDEEGDDGNKAKKRKRDKKEKKSKKSKRQKS